MALSNASSFIGRETFLQDLHTLLQNDRRVVVSGMDGVGKTAAAREYVRRFSSYYQSIFWMNASTDELFLERMSPAVSRVAQMLKAG